MDDRRLRSSLDAGPEGLALNRPKRLVGRHRPRVDRSPFMTLPRSDPDVLACHVTLEVECIDRMYLNVYVPKLQFVEAWCRSCAPTAASRPPPRRCWSRSARTSPPACTAGLYRFAKDQGVAIVDFIKGQRKDDLAQEFLAEFDSDEGVLFVGRAQEKAPVFRTEKRRKPTTGATYSWIVRTTAMVNHFYIYTLGADFGPFFKESAGRPEPKRAPI